MPRVHEYVLADYDVSIISVSVSSTNRTVLKYSVRAGLMRRIGALTRPCLVYVCWVHGYEFQDMYLAYVLELAVANRIGRIGRFEKRDE